MTKATKGSQKFALEQELAPNTDPHWAEEFILTLRLAGVSGTHIGDALAVVDSHCADSAEHPQETFGSARTYARSLELPTDPDQGLKGVLTALAPTGVQLAGMALTLTSWTAHLEGNPFTLGWGALLVSVCFLATVSAGYRYLGWILNHPWLTGALFSLTLGIGAVGSLWLDARETSALITLPALPCVVVGVALLIVGTILEVLDARTGTTEDPIVQPLVSAERRTVDWRAVARAFLVPVGTIVLATIPALMK